MSDIFPDSRWTLILTQQQPEAGLPSTALNELCKIYWQPVFDFIRRKSNSTEDAEDLAQAYFESLLQRNYLKEADPSRGKFRAFLLKDIQFFLSNQRRKGLAESRGGGRASVSLDAETSEGTKFPEPASQDITPDVDFDKRFAAALLSHSLQRLSAESTLEDREFQEIRRFLFWGDGEDSYRDVAANLQTTEGNVKTKVKRLRDCFRKIIRDEVNHAVNDPSEIDSELRYLSQLMENL